MNVNSPIPLYHQFAEEIRSQIIKGELKPGEKLRAEGWYVGHYNVSRVTVRKGLEELVQSGYVVHETNKRYYVNEGSFENWSHKESVYEILTSRGIKVTSKILKMELQKADDKVKAGLDCSQNAPVVMIYRLRLADGEPFALQKIWLLESMFPEFNPWELVQGSLRKTMEQKYCYQILNTREAINACMPDDEMMLYLQMDEPQPLVHILTKALTENNLVAEYSETFFLTEKFDYIIEH
ncbi:GntR family transcriptional regulator [Faecalicatena orotica]|jgi:DNA-binding GntR family transcriptional regulator|uniref:GntR family transcriptional regulator n=1 Tax=Faecalicatena orotica TaxID=1544 RepID=UPI0032178ECD